MFNLANIIEFVVDGLDEAVGKLPAHVVAYVAEIERFEVTVAHGVEEYEDGHHLAVRHAARTVAAAFATCVQLVFFSVRGRNICRTRREYRKCLLNLYLSWERMFFM